MTVLLQSVLSVRCVVNITHKCFDQSDASTHCTHVLWHQDSSPKRPTMCEMAFSLLVHASPTSFASNVSVTYCMFYSQHKSKCSASDVQYRYVTTLNSSLPGIRASIMPQISSVTPTTTLYMSGSTLKSNASANGNTLAIFTNCFCCQV